MDTLAERVNYLLISSGLSVTAAAKKSGVPQPRLNDIVSGKTLNPHTKTTDKIAEYFEVSKAWLVSNIGPMRDETAIESTENYRRRKLNQQEKRLMKQTISSLIIFLEENKREMGPKDLAETAVEFYEFFLDSQVQEVSSKTIEKVFNFVKSGMPGGRDAN